MRGILGVQLGQQVPGARGWGEILHLKLLGVFLFLMPVHPNLGSRNQCVGEGQEASGLVGCPGLWGWGSKRLLAPWGWEKT